MMPSSCRPQSRIAPSTLSISTRVAVAGMQHTNDPQPHSEGSVCGHQVRLCIRGRLQLQQTGMPDKPGAEAAHLTLCLTCCGRYSLSTCCSRSRRLASSSLHTSLPCCSWCSVWAAAWLPSCSPGESGDGQPAVSRGSVAAGACCCPGDSCRGSVWGRLASAAELLVPFASGAAATASASDGEQPCGS